LNNTYDVQKAHSTRPRVLETAAGNAVKPENKQETSEVRK